MTLYEVLMVGLGGFLGAVIRHIISRHLNQAMKIPIGTLTVNLTGALLIGFVFGLGLPVAWSYLLASGLAGALTTFSTMNNELLQLWKGGAKGKATIYLLSSYLLGIGFAYTGYSVSSSL